MAVPKKKTSKRRSGNRKSANTKLSPIVLTKCPKCGEPKKSHIACGYCGFYGDKKVLEVESKLDKKIRKQEKAEKAAKEDK